MITVRYASYNESVDYLINVVKLKSCIYDKYSQMRCAFRSLNANPCDTLQFWTGVNSIRQAKDKLSFDFF